MIKYLMFIKQPDGTFKNSKGLWVGSPPPVSSGNVVIIYPETGNPTYYTYNGTQLTYPRSTATTNVK